MFCGQCGTNNVEGIKFCVKCGAELAAMRPPDELPPVELTPLEQAPTPSESEDQSSESANPGQTEPVGLACPKCGTDNSPETLACVKCGAAILKKCPFCSHLNKPATKYCGVCGSNTQQTLDYQEHLAKGRDFEQNHRYLHAILEYQAILTHNPAHPEAKEGLRKVNAIQNRINALIDSAERAWQESNYEAARDNYQAVIKLLPAENKFRDKFNELLELIRRKDIDKYTAAIKNAMAQGNFNAALDQARQLLALDPQSELASSIISTIDEKRDQHVSLQKAKREAMRQLRHIGIIFGVMLIIFFAFYSWVSCNNNRNHLKAGRQLIEKKKSAQALKELQMCGNFGIDADDKKRLIGLAAEGLYPSWLSDAQTSYNQQNYNEALENLNQVIQYRPDDPAALALKARIAPAEGLVLNGINEAGYEEYLHQATNMVFVLIPAGTFLMGNNEALDAKPTHSVTLKSYFMAKYEVTQGAWKKVMQNNPARFKAGDNYPVEKVSWPDCQEFCAKAGLRLPTEAEWEYACRGNTTTKFYWGDKENEANLWYENNAEKSTHPVGQKNPNQFGLCDMSGNVCEWCSDWYEAGYYQTSPAANPTGPAVGQYRVVRGGGWNDKANDAGSAYRYWMNPKSQSEFVGFRCVKDVK